MKCDKRLCFPQHLGAKRLEEKKFFKEKHHLAMLSINMWLQFGKKA